METGHQKFSITDDVNIDKLIEMMSCNNAILSTTFKNNNINPGVTSIDSEEAFTLSGFSEDYWMESYKVSINCMI